MSNEGLPQKHRPKFLKGLVGQEAAVRVIRGYCSGKAIPRAVLLTGPSGTGKTTTARILADKTGARGGDVNEINCADARGIDMVRNIHATMRFRGLGKGGGNRVYILDEVHQLTGDAQTALLKSLEDPPSHIYFFLCTTNPNKVLETIRSRCKLISMRALDPTGIREVVTRVAAKEKFKVHPDVMSKIINVSNGSPRRALNALEQVMQVKGRQCQLDAISPDDVETMGHELFRLMMDGRKQNWFDAKELIKSLKQEAEGVRRIVLACCVTAALGDKVNPRVIDIIEAFRDHYLDCDKAGLIASVWEVLHSAKA